MHCVTDRTFCSAFYFCFLFQSLKSRKMVQRTIIIFPFLFAISEACCMTPSQSSGCIAIPPPPPPVNKTFSIVNTMDSEAYMCKIHWENAANCPPQTCGDGLSHSVNPNCGTATVSYIAWPFPVACGKLASVQVLTGRRPILLCNLTNAPSHVVPTLYIKKYGLGTEATCDFSSIPPPTNKTFTIINRMDTEAFGCKITWENAANCPPQDCNEPNHIIDPNGKVTVSYIAQPPLLACGKLASVQAYTGRKRVLICKLTNAPSSVVPTLYIKKYWIGTGATCEFSASPITKG